MMQRVIALSIFLVFAVLADVSVSAQTLTQQLKAETAEKLAIDAREKGDAIRGAILFTKKNLKCTVCHAPGVAKPIGPNLNGLGDDATDAYLVEALLEPSKVIKKGFESTLIVTTKGKSLIGRIISENDDKVELLLASGDLPRLTIPRDEIDELVPSKVSAMPKELVDQLANRQQFLDLVRYVMQMADSEASTSPIVSGGKTIADDLQGIVLLKEFNCAACHLDDVSQTQLTTKQAPDLSQSVANLNPAFVERIIADPLATKPGTTMPHMMSQLTGEERSEAAKQITHYLMSLRKTEAVADKEINSASVARGREYFHSVGCVACHSPRDTDYRETLAKSSVPLVGVHLKYNFDGLVAFLENPLKYRPSGRMPKMALSHWEAVDVASYLLSQPHDQANSATWKIDENLAAKGKSRFEQLACVQCHQVGSNEAKPTALPLSRVNSDNGCLSAESGKWPTFSITESQREAIQAALSRESQVLSDRDEIAVTLTALRCVNCHQRDELGGVSQDRDPYFRTTNPNLGPQGRIPPTLTGVGAKLNAKWMRSVLVSGRAIRPYVLTRMPQYGADNVGYLVGLCQQTDELPEIEFAEFKDQKMMRQTGHEMAGTAGLNCIACHTFQLKQAANMPAVDLTEMAERLKKEWYYHYMKNPQSLSPNTIMPSFWPGGRAMRSDILAGNADQQIEATWQYLLDGRQARAPRGLIVKPLELLATDEAVMLRRSYPNVGKRGIGVGYPKQVNLVFDAEQMRLAMIWKGKFADPASVWRGQGSGRVRPLGEDLVNFAPGPDLDSFEKPWVPDDGRPPQHQFKGYSLDEQMRPRLRYLFDGIKVEDYSVDVISPSTNTAYLRRTIKLSCDTARDDVAFRAATGKSIVRGDNGEYVVDDRLRISIGGRDAAKISVVGDVKALLIPLNLKKGSTQFSINYKW